jgi:uridine kinase
MNQPFSPLDEQMYREIREDLRGVSKSVEKVHDELTGHLHEEMQQYAHVHAQLTDIRIEIAKLKTKMAFGSAMVSAIVAAVTVWLSKLVP